MNKKLSFLQAVAGADGYGALAKASSLSPDLEWAVLPGCILNWIEAISCAPYDADLPGITGSRLKLAKADDTYSGCISLGPDTYDFDNVSVYHVAGSVAVALGADAAPAPDLQHPALAKLAKSVALLVKARTLRKMAKPQGGAAGGKGVKLPGVAAKPIEPALPVPPTPIAPKPTGPAAGTKVAVAGASAKAKKPGAAIPGTATKPVLPGTKPRKPTLKVTKSESLRLCPACGQQQFAENKYSPCICFKSLSKSVKTVVVEGGYVLEFGVGWDQDALCVVAEGFGK